MVDGIQRPALAGAIADPGVDGARPVATDDQADELVVDVASGTLDDVPTIATRLVPLVGPR